MTDLASQPPLAMPVKTAVIGASGNVGRYLWRSYRSAYPDCVGTSFSNPGEGLTFFDIRKPDLAALRLEETGHKAILISSAKANVSYCEQQLDAARAVNVEGTLELIRQAGRTSLQVIFFSTDYVFEGIQGPHDDDAPLRPTTEYGRQKVAVETALPSLVKNYLVLRLSKIFATEKGDRTLLDDIASNLAEGRVVRAARDQIFCPTYAGDLVQAVHGIQARGLQGAMNVAHPRRWSRADVAIAMARSLQANPALVEVISLYDIPAMAGRPRDTSMACSRLMREVGPTFHPLETFIERVAANWR